MESGDKISQNGENGTGEFGCGNSGFSPARKMDQLMRQVGAKRLGEFGLRMLRGSALSPAE